MELTGTLVRVETRPDLGDCLVLQEKVGVVLIMTNCIRRPQGVEAPWPLEAKHVFWIDRGFIFPAHYIKEVNREA